MLHKATKAGNIPRSGGIVGDNQQGFPGLHGAYGFAHHHHGFRAAQPLRIKSMVRAGEKIGHFHLTQSKTAVVYAAFYLTQARLTIACILTIAKRSESSMMRRFKLGSLTPTPKKVTI